MKINRIYIYVLSCIAFLLTVGALQTSISVYTIGDSTMSLYDSTKDWRVGWAQKLPQFFTGAVIIKDAARSGRSSKSFIDEGLWTNVINQVQSGDYVFIQFAHNDEKSDVALHTDPWTTYSDNLRKFVNETRAKGGYPILCTPIVRRYLGADGHITATGMHNVGTGDSVGNYPAAMRWIAGELSVPLLDLTLKTKTLVESYGPDSSKKLYNYVAAGVTPLYPSGNTDDTHLNAFGAVKVAELCVQGLQETGSSLATFLAVTNVNGKRTNFATPKDYILVQNFPNPFNPSTTIVFSLGTSSHMSLYVYDIFGREVTAIFEGFKSAGSYTVKFDGSNLSSGIYFLRLKTATNLHTLKIVLTK
jgi:lysophospholipase L1-like esterase